MKKITASTILKQGNKMFLPVEIDKVIYWEAKDFDPNESAFYIYTKADGSKEINFVEDGAVIGETKVIAQSKWQHQFNNTPVINLDEYIKHLPYYKQNLPHSRKDNEDHRDFLLRVGKMAGFEEGYKANPNHYTQQDIEKAIELAREFNFYLRDTILEKINSISIIEVDDKFNIISFE